MDQYKEINVYNKDKILDIELYYKQFKNNL